LKREIFAAEACRCLELLASITRETIGAEPEIADRVESAAAYISSRETFLS
jgi:hypothetical protein